MPCSVKITRAYHRPFQIQIPLTHDWCSLRSSELSSIASLHILNQIWSFCCSRALPGVLDRKRKYIVQILKYRLIYNERANRRNWCWQFCLYNMQMVRSRSSRNYEMCKIRARAAECDSLRPTLLEKKCLQPYTLEISPLPLPVYQVRKLVYIGLDVPKFFDILPDVDLHCALTAGEPWTQSPLRYVDL